MGFDRAMILAVWKKGHLVPTIDSAQWRKDDCGAWMSFQKYGIRGSDYGWEIDHIVTVDDDGLDDVDNLRPLQWENNAARGSEDGLVCPVTSNGNKNVPV